LLRLGLWIGLLQLAASAGLILAASVVGRLIPTGQIVPIVVYDNPVVVLVDTERHLMGYRPRGSTVVFDAAVSPDQQWIAYSRSDGRRVQVFLSGLYGTDEQQLTPGELGGDSPAWSPDGSQIAFVATEDAKRNLYRMAARPGAEPVQLLEGGNVATPAWSPDGKALILAASRFSNLADLYLLADASCAAECEAELREITSTLVIDTQPIWSPDGSQIAFLSDRSGNYEIYTLPTDCFAPGETCIGQNPRRLRINRLAIPFFLVWSFDASQLYFRAWDMRANQPGLYRIQTDCFSRSEGCRAEIIYNLGTIISQTAR